MAMSLLKTVEDVQSARDDVERAVDEMLRRNGWKRTCATPGALWLWERKLADGRTMLVDKETAILFEQLTFTGDDEGSSHG